MKDVYALERDLREMKTTYHNVVNANIKLSDEKTLVLRDNKMLQKKIDNAIDYIRNNDKFLRKDLLEILQQDF